VPRKMRIEFSGASHHITNRGNYRCLLFRLPKLAESFCGCPAADSKRACRNIAVFRSRGLHLALKTD
jgi:hypothetical protein